MSSKAVIIKRLTALTLATTFFVTEVALGASVDLIKAPAALLPPQAILQDPTFFEPPIEFVVMKEVHKGSNGTFIIHIQDAHANLSGQENLSSALDRIMTRYGISVVLSEGGFQDASLNSLKKIAPAAVWKKIAKKYLLEGKISGEEYLNLTSDHPMKIVGIEDAPLYVKSVANYGRLAAQREEILPYLKRIHTALEKTKARVYPAELLGYERVSGGAIKQSRDKNADLNIQFLLELAARKQVSLEPHPNIARLVQLQEKEKGISFESANLEQAALAEQIQKKGGKDGLRDFMDRAEAMREKKISQHAYFQNTFQIAREKGIDLGRYPNLALYGDYLKDFSEIDFDALLTEAMRLEDGLYLSTLTGEDQKLVRALDRYVNLLWIAYNIQMSTDEFSVFLANQPDFSTIASLAFLNRQLAQLGYFEDLVPYADCLERGQTALMDFYDSVSRRDFAFLANAERVLASEGQKVAVLISGGYHTPHLKKLFREKGYSFAVLTPLVSSETNQRKYEKLLMAPLGPEKDSVLTVQSGPRASKSLSALEKDLIRKKKTNDGVKPVLISPASEEVAGPELASFTRSNFNALVDEVLDELSANRQVRGQPALTDAERRNLKGQVAAPVATVLPTATQTLAAEDLGARLASLSDQLRSIESLKNARPTSAADYPGAYARLERELNEARAAKSLQRANALSGIYLAEARSMTEKVLGGVSYPAEVAGRRVRLSAGQSMNYLENFDDALRVLGEIEALIDQRKAALTAELDAADLKQFPRTLTRLRQSIAGAVTLQDVLNTEAGFVEAAREMVTRMLGNSSVVIARPAGARVRIGPSQGLGYIETFQDGLRVQEAIRNEFNALRRTARQQLASGLENQPAAKAELQIAVNAAKTLDNARALSDAFTQKTREVIRELLDGSEFVTTLADGRRVRLGSQQSLNYIESYEQGVAVVREIEKQIGDLLGARLAVTGTPRSEPAMTAFWRAVFTGRETFSEALRQSYAAYTPDLLISGRTLQLPLRSEFTGPQKIQAERFLGTEFEEADIRALLAKAAREGIRDPYVTHLKSVLANSELDDLSDKRLSRPTEFTREDALRLSTLNIETEALRVEAEALRTELGLRYDPLISHQVALPVEELIRPRNGGLTHVYPRPAVLGKFLQKLNETFSEYLALDPRTADKGDVIRKVAAVYQLAVNAHPFIDAEPENRLLLELAEQLLKRHGLAFDRSAAQLLLNAALGLEPANFARIFSGSVSRSQARPASTPGLDGTPLTSSRDGTAVAGVSRLAVPVDMSRLVEVASGRAAGQALRAGEVNNLLIAIAENERINVLAAPGDDFFIVQVQGEAFIRRRGETFSVRGVEISVSDKISFRNRRPGVVRAGRERGATPLEELYGRVRTSRLTNGARLADSVLGKEVLERSREIVRDIRLNLAGYAAELSNLPADERLLDKVTRRVRELTSGVPLKARNIDIGGLSDIMINQIRPGEAQPVSTASIYGVEISYMRRDRSLVKTLTEAQARRLLEALATDIESRSRPLTPLSVPEIVLNTLVASRKAADEIQNDLNYFAGFFERLNAGPELLSEVESVIERLTLGVPLARNPLGRIEDILVNVPRSGESRPVSVAYVFGVEVSYRREDGTVVKTLTRASARQLLQNLARSLEERAAVPLAAGADVLPAARQVLEAAETALADIQRGRDFYAKILTDLPADENLVNSVQDLIRELTPGVPLQRRGGFAPDILSEIYTGVDKPGEPQKVSTATFFGVELSYMRQDRGIVKTLDRAAAERLLQALEREIRSRITPLAPGFEPPIIREVILTSRSVSGELRQDLDLLAGILDSIPAAADYLQKIESILVRQARNVPLARTALGSLASVRVNVPRAGEAQTVSTASIFGVEVSYRRQDGSTVKTLSRDSARQLLENMVRSIEDRAGLPVAVTRGTEGARLADVEPAVLLIEGNLSNLRNMTREAASRALFGEAEVERKIYVERVGSIGRSLRGLSGAVRYFAEQPSQDSRNDLRARAQAVRDAAQLLYQSASAYPAAAEAVLSQVTPIIEIALNASSAAEAAVTAEGLTAPGHAEILSALVSSGGVVFDEVPVTNLTTLNVIRDRLAEKLEEIAVLADLYSPVSTEFFRWDSTSGTVNVLNLEGFKRGFQSDSGALMARQAEEITAYAAETANEIVFGLRIIPRDNKARVEGYSDRIGPVEYVRTISQVREEEGAGAIADVHLVNFEGDQRVVKVFGGSQLSRYVVDAAQPGTASRLDVNSYTLKGYEESRRTFEPTIALAALVADRPNVQRHFPRVIRVFDEGFVQEFWNIRAQPSDPENVGSGIRTLRSIELYFASEPTRAELERLAQGGKVATLSEDGRLLRKAAPGKAAVPLSAQSIAALRRVDIQRQLRGIQNDLIRPLEGPLETAGLGQFMFDVQLSNFYVDQDGILFSIDFGTLLDYEGAEEFMKTSNEAFDEQIRSTAAGIVSPEAGARLALKANTQTEDQFVRALDEVAAKRRAGQAVSEAEVDELSSKLDRVLEERDRLDRETNPKGPFLYAARAKGLASFRNDPSAGDAALRLELARLVTIYDMTDPAGRRREITYHEENHFNELLDFSRSVRADNASKLKNAEKIFPLLYIAVYLHDLGYFHSDASVYAPDHEERSKTKVDDFAYVLGLTPEEVSVVKYLIDKTKFKLAIPGRRGQGDFGFEVLGDNSVYRDIESSSGDRVKLSPETADYLNRNFSGRYGSDLDLVRDAILAGKIIALADIYAQDDSNPYLVTRLQPEFVHDDNDASLRETLLARPTRLEQVSDSVGFNMFSMVARLNFLLYGVDDAGNAFTRESIDPKLSINVDAAKNGRDQGLTVKKQVGSWISDLVNKPTSDEDSQAAAKGLIEFVESGVEAGVLTAEDAEVLRGEIEVFKIRQATNRSFIRVALEDRFGVSVEPAVLEALLKASELYGFKDGKVLFREGKTLGENPFVYLIVDGSVEVVGPGVNTVVKSGFVGEMAIVGKTFDPKSQNLDSLVVSYLMNEARAVRRQIIAGKEYLLWETGVRPDLLRKKLAVLDPVIVERVIAAFESATQPPRSATAVVDGGAVVLRIPANLFLEATKGSEFAELVTSSVRNTIIKNTQAVEMGAYIARAYDFAPKAVEGARLALPFPSDFQEGSIVGRNIGGTISVGGKEYYKNEAGFLDLYREGFRMADLSFKITQDRPDAPDVSGEGFAVTTPKFILEVNGRDGWVPLRAVTLQEDYTVMVVRGVKPDNLVLDRIERNPNTGRTEYRVFKYREGTFAEGSLESKREFRDLEASDPVTAGFDDSRILVTFTENQIQPVTVLLPASIYTTSVSRAYRKDLPAKTGDRSEGRPMAIEREDGEYLNEATGQRFSLYPDHSQPAAMGITLLNTFTEIPRVEIGNYGSKNDIRFYRLSDLRQAAGRPEFNENSVEIHSLDGELSVMSSPGSLIDLADEFNEGRYVRLRRGQSQEFNIPVGEPFEISVTIQGQPVPEATAMLRIDEKFGVEGERILTFSQRSADGTWVEIGKSFAGDKVTPGGQHAIEGEEFRSIIASFILRLDNSGTVKATNISTDQVNIRMLESSDSSSGARLAESAERDSAVRATPTGAEISDYRFQKVAGVQLSQTPLDSIQKVVTDAKDFPLLIELAVRAAGRAQNTPFLFTAGYSTISIEQKGQDSYSVRFENPLFTSTYEITPDAVASLRSKAQTTVTTEGELVRDVVVEQTVSETQVGLRTAIRAHTKLPLDLNTPTVHLLDIDHFIRPEALELAKAQVDYLSRQARFKNTYVLFVSTSGQNTARAQALNQGVGVPSGTDTRLMYHGDIDKTQKDDLRQMLEAALKDMGQPLPPGLKLGFSGFKTDNQQGAVMPFAAQIVFADIVTRLDLDNLPSDLASILKPLVVYLKIELGPELFEDRQNLALIQSFDPKQYSRYIKLAVQAIARLDINQFIQYTKLAVRAIGAAA